MGIGELGFCVRWISRGNSGVQIGNQVRGCVDRCTVLYDSIAEGCRPACGSPSLRLSPSEGCSRVSSQALFGCEAVPE